METYSIDETEDVLPEEDSREQLQERIAELLAELSEATDTPKGVQPCAQFTAGDVSFGSDTWMTRLAEVQGWLHFSDDLSTSDPAAFAASLAEALGFETQAEGIESAYGTPLLTETALELLSERAEIAARLQQVFLAELDAEGGSRASATASWNEAWVTVDDSAEAVVPEPVTAKADVWHIFQLTKKKLNLTPSYQRGDVWRTGDRQALIESILRGIPLPSIILLRTGGTTPHDVVDGKQRLTAILRFVGQHPIALKKVEEADGLHGEAQFPKLFAEDYPKFRRAWKRYMGEPLTAKLEDDYYFPFKLRNDGKGGLVGDDLEPLRGRYFTEIRDKAIHVADQEVTVEDLFGGAPDYKVPVIEYTKASQRQIHEVFKLYNKQGMHLNAEEIRNAIYHDVDLTRAILVAAGDVTDRSNIAKVAPWLVGVPGIRDLGNTLADYGFGEARYRRTKVLGWIVATLINDTRGKLLPSTARHTDLLLSQVQDNSSHALRDGAKIADLFALIAQAAELHAAHDELWPDKFRGDGKSGKWQDLQLVGSLVGIAIAMAGAPDDIEDRIDLSASAIRSAALDEWKRPEKTQTRTQWDYIARIVHGVVEKLDVDISTASEAIRARFGSSGVESLLGSILQPKAE
ncbi:DUF262 domain-containing protein [Arthrobacter sp. I2-34]|uniref:DUF262 domain-containing protein n=1 Tax=Arthrobacter hankyongi TaxID=2904801 RepID=A0ABS9L7G1_9MICC|nr:DUF262 domain-containing protein [Arthrobacter hankyongi]MCG2622620.1 DUF262 domain-containing protein [Arthrobacter hankyongi]